MENQLKLQNISYKAFLKGVQDNPARQVHLEPQAALKLHKYKFIKNNTVMNLSMASIICILLALIGNFFIMGWPLLLLLAIFPIYVMARRSCNEAAWREILGEGQLSFKQREKIYQAMVEHDYLWTEEW